MPSGSCCAQAVAAAGSRSAQPATRAGDRPIARSAGRNVFRISDRGLRIEFRPASDDERDEHAFFLRLLQRFDEGQDFLHVFGVDRIRQLAEGGVSAPSAAGPGEGGFDPGNEIALGIISLLRLCGVGSSRQGSARERARERDRRRLVRGRGGNRERGPRGGRLECGSRVAAQGETDEKGGESNAEGEKESLHVIHLAQVGICSSDRILSFDRHRTRHVAPCRPTQKSKKSRQRNGQPRQKRGGESLFCRECLSRRASVLCQPINFHCARRRLDNPEFAHTRAGDESSRFGPRSSWAVFWGKNLPPPNRARPRRRARVRQEVRRMREKRDVWLDNGVVAQRDVARAHRTITPSGFCSRYFRSAVLDLPGDELVSSIGCRRHMKFSVRPVDTSAPWSPLFREGYM